MDSRSSRNAAMSDARLVSTGRQRSLARLRPSERRVAVASAAGVLVAAAAIWAAAPATDRPWVVAALLVAGYAACTRVSFEVVRDRPPPPSSRLPR